MSKPISVLFVDDSPIALAMMRRAVEAAPGIEVVGTAGNGEEALAAIGRLDPMVVCTDLHMPRMGGLALVREIMTTCPRPIVVVSISVQKDDPNNAFRLLEAGAVDVCPKPRGGTLEDGSFAAELVRKIRVVAGVRVIRRFRHAPAAAKAAPKIATNGFARGRIVAIGASTGGPVALRTILSGLPPDVRLPILCVQHISTEFLPGFVEWLQGHCRLRLALAAAGEVVRPGTVYFPPADSHLEVGPGGRLCPKREAAVDGHCPSVNVTFRSVAAQYGPNAVGVLLTGMGVDGAAGLADIARAGGETIAQDEESCVVFGMPGHAVQIGAAKHVLSLQEIAGLLARELRGGPREVDDARVSVG